MTSRSLEWLLFLKKTVGNKRWQECGETGIFVRRRRECQMAPLLWETVRRLLENREENHRVIQQFRFWKYTQKDWQPGLRERSVPLGHSQPCSQELKGRSAERPPTDD